MNEQELSYEKFTVVIPEHKRPEHLKRLLDYLLNYGIRVIVADSSEIEFRYKSEFEGRITYRFFPKTILGEKLHQILPLIQTPFVVMCANDDFLVPESVHTIISFLEKNQDYNSGQGIYIDFSAEGDEIHTSMRYKNTIDIDLNDANPSDRLFQLQRNYFQYYYAVFRTETFTKAINSVVEAGQAKIKNLCLLESYLSSFTAIGGKHMILPIFYAARENILDSAASNTDTIPTIISENKYAVEYESYVSLLSKNLSAEQEISTAKAREIIEQSVTIYVKNLHPDFYTLRGRIKNRVKIWIKKTRMFNLLMKLKVRETREQENLIGIMNFEHWKKIEHYIRKYNYIYKNQE